MAYAAAIVLHMWQFNRFRWVAHSSSGRQVRPEQKEMIIMKVTDQFSSWVQPTVLSKHAKKQEQVIKS